MCKKIIALLLLIFTGPLFAAEVDIPLMKVKINPNDYASLQRGAKLYANYCQACHSLEYMRYDRMGKDIGITDKYGRLDEKTVQENLIFADSRITDLMTNAADKKDLAKWFGVPPPDLTLVTRVRGVNWLYTYLLSFYPDEHRPWGVNNAVFPDVAMPNVLEGLQGIQKPIFDSTMDNVKKVTGVELVTEGALSQEEFEHAVKDIVNYLDYVGEPFKKDRQQLGWWVLGFLIILLVLSYLIKRQYWKDIK